MIVQLSEYFRRSCSLFLHLSRVAIVLHTHQTIGWSVNVVKQRTPSNYSGFFSYSTAPLFCTLPFQCIVTFDHSLTLALHLQVLLSPNNSRLV